MSSGSLSPLADPLALARLQVLLIPVHRGGAEPVLTEALYEHWTGLFRKHQTLRGDEVVHSHGTALAHRRGTADSPRSRFLPSAPGSSISRTASANHVHLAFPSQPPARHLYPLSLLRMSAFPLVVIGIAVDDAEEDSQGFSVSDTSIGSEKQMPTDTWARTFDHALSAFLPSTAAFPLVKKLVLVPSQLPQPNAPQRSPADKDSGKAPWSASEGSVRRAPFEGGDSWVGRLLGEVVGEVFGEFGELASSLESPAGLRTLGSTLLPSLSIPDQNAAEEPTTGDSPAQTPTNSRPSSVASNRASHLGPSASLPTSSRSPLARTLTPGGRPTSVQPPSAPPIQSKAVAPPASSPSSMSSNPFRRSTALTSPFQRSSSSNSLAVKDKDTGGAAKNTSAPLGGIAGGRLLKLLGDMYLLTGTYSDAIKCYEDGAERSRAVGDVLWEALAREGRAVAAIGEAWQGRDGSTNHAPFPSAVIPVEVLSHYLSALACLSRAPLPFPPTILSPAPQSVRDSISQQSQSSPVLAQIGTGEGLLAWLYTSLCLRISHFTLVIFAAGGWGSIAVSSLMAHTLPRSFPALTNRQQHSRGRSRRQALAQLAASSQLQRHAILGHGEAALGSFRLAMTKAEQVAVLVEIVHIARWLELERKEAAATRELVKVLASVIVEGRDESKRLLAQFARSERQTVSGEIDSESGSSNVIAAQQAIAIRRRESTDGNAGIIDLVQRVCAVLGIDLLSFSSGHEPHVVRANEDDDYHFGWPELQVGAIKDATAIAEALQDSTSVVRLCLSALRSLYGYLGHQHQHQLAKLYPSALATMRRRALDIGPIPWWLPGRVVLSIEISSLPPNKTPFEHSRAEIAPVEAKGKKDPFLYNPRLKAPEPGKTVLVAAEQVDVFVTLQNVFAFDLEIQDLSLLTSGSPFITTPLPLMLPATSVQTIRVTGVAPTSGFLEIKGVHIRLMDGSEAEFLLPVSSNAEATRNNKRRSQLRADLGKTKRQGLAARRSVVIPSEFLHSLPPATTEDETKWLECSVVESQPLLWIKKTSLSHGSVMLYDGERSVIQVTLENSSPVPVDFVRLSFDDSVTREAQGLLSDNELALEQAYALEQDLFQRPVFAWDSSSQISIPPGGRATLSIRVLGKVGCTDGTIRIDYGYINRSDKDAASASFHTRRLTLPVLFTVYRTLECFATDVACLRSNASHQEAKQRLMNGGTPRHATFAASSDDELRHALVKIDDRSVLFCVNVRNVFSVPFEIALSVNEAQNDNLVVTRLVPPGATERLVLPIPRQFLELEERLKPIPSSRQYLVDKRKSPEEAQRHREHFWFRERLLSMISISWREPGSLRSGSLSLQDQQISPAHIENFRLDEVSVQLEVQPRSETLHAMDFVDLRITVQNNLERKVRPYVRLEALPTSSNDTSWSVPAPPPAPRRVSSLPAAPQPVPKTVAFDGALASTLTVLGPGENATHVVGAVLLASGRYTFRAAAEEVNDPSASDSAPPNILFSPSVSVDVA